MSETAGFGNEDLANIKKTADEALLNINNERLQRLPRLRSSIQNLKEILSREQLAYKKVSSETPAIVCGAGPSLTSHMPLIKKLSDKAVIIVSGRLGSTFKENGISPDFVVHLDAELDGDPSLAELPDSTLIAAPGTSPAVISKFNKIIWTRGDSIFFNRFLRENEIDLHDLRISMTSTVTALDLAIKIGCSNIMLAGCDLCLSPKGASHATGKKSPAYQDDIIEAPGNAGGKVTTLKEFNILRIAIENFLESVLDEGANFYNCALEGATIKNAPTMPLEEFESRFVRHKINKELTEKRSACFPDLDIEKIKDILKEYADFSNERLKCLEEIKKNKDSASIVSGLSKGLALLEKKLFELSSDPKAKNFATAINQSAEEIFPETQNSMIEQARFSRDLCLDMLKDFNWNGKSESRPCTRKFEAFKNLAVDFIEQNNAELADALKNEIFKKDELECVLFLKGIGIPSATVGVCTLSDYENSARKDIEDFSNQTAFNPSKNACVIVDPGNWLCAVEFARKYPEADLIIADPRPGLLSKIIRRCVFTHHFNKKTLALVADEKIPNWKKLYSEKLASLKTEGKEIVFFKPSSTWKFTETKNFFERLQAL
jgi:hypothetical protein